jgi:hypothetical protein
VLKINPLDAKDQDRRWRNAVRICLLIALAARLGIDFYAFGRPARFDYPDTRRYIRVAENIFGGAGPIEGLSSRCSTDPVYPYLLALGKRLGLTSYDNLMDWGRGVNLLFGLGALVAAMRLARRVGGVEAAMAAGVITALDPIFVYFHALVLTEVPYACLLWWGCEWLLCAMETGLWGYAALSAAALGAGTLTRSSGLLMPVALLPIFLMVREKSDGSPLRRWRLLLVWVLAYAATLAPATIRYWRQLGTFTVVRTGLGPTLLDSFGPRADGGTGMDRVDWPEFPPGVDEYTREQICRRHAWEWIRNNSNRSLELAWAKLRRTWSIDLHAPGFDRGIYQTVARFSVTPVFALAVIGVYLLRRRPAALWALLGPILYFTALHCVIIGSVRYRVPLLPGLFVLAGLPIGRLAARRRPAPPSPRVLR